MKSRNGNLDLDQWNWGIWIVEMRFRVEWQGQGFLATMIWGWMEEEMNNNEMREVWIEGLQSIRKDEGYDGESENRQGGGGGGGGGVRDQSSCFPSFRQREFPGNHILRFGLSTNLTATMSSN